MSRQCVHRSSGTVPSVALGLAALSIFFCQAARAQLDEGRACPAGASDCFPYRDMRVDLVPSEVYETVTLPTNATADDLEAIRSRILSENLGRVTQFSSLEDDRTLVVQLNEDAGSPDSLGRQREQLNAVLESFNSERLADQVGRAVTGRDASGNPVYSDGETTFVLVNEFIVQFVPQSNREDRLALLERYGAEIVRDYGSRNWYVVRFSGSNARQGLSIANTLHYEPIVQFAQPGFIELARTQADGAAAAPAASCPMPSSANGQDPLFAEQWYLDNEGAAGTQFADINAVNAWQVTTGTPDIVIAVIDDGVDLFHPDLQSKLVAGWDAFEDDNDPSPRSWDYHGTAVAGVAAAATGNSHGIKSIASDASIMPVRVYETPYQNAPRAEMPHPALKAGIEAAAETAHVLNNSWVRSQSPLVNNAIEAGVDYALSLGRVVLFAVGNEGQQVRYPALLSTSIDGDGNPRPLIAVGATDSYDQPTSWSNFGADRVSVVAPGLHIVSTDISGAGGRCSGDYVIFSGTSAATPLVAGTAALIVSEEETIASDTLRERLQSTTNSSAYDQKTGHGRIDACKALLGANCGRGQEPLSPQAPADLSAD